MPKCHVLVLFEAQLGEHFLGIQLLFLVSLFCLLFVALQRAKPALERAKPTLERAKPTLKEPNWHSKQKNQNRLLSA